MLRPVSLVLFFVLSLMKGVSAEYCPSGFNSYYYCYPGQTCGTYYGDCRGLPTYLIVTIVSSCILLFSICVRCCIHLNSPKAQPMAQRVPVPPQNPGHVGIQVHSFTNNLATRSPANAPIHSIREDDPPSYASVISANAGQTKH